MRHVRPLAGDVRNLLKAPPISDIAFLRCFSHLTYPNAHESYGQLEPRVGGGVRPKTEKKLVTSPILMVEVVIDMPEGTSAGSPGVQDMFQCLKLKMAKEITVGIGAN